MAEDASADRGRALDEPHLQLGRIDEHAVVVNASRANTWRALRQSVEASRHGDARRLGARLLGCENTEGNAVPVDRTGATTVGFYVAAVESERRLELAGAHRWSRYALIYSLEEASDRAVRLQAETRAEFPGLSGRFYRLLVIDSRLHVLAIRSTLRSIKQRAEALQSQSAWT